MKTQTILSVRPATKPRTPASPTLYPFMSMDERILIESASRLEGVTPPEFLKEAGVAWALSVLDEVGKGEHKGRHPSQPSPKSRQRG